LKHPVAVERPSDSIEPPVAATEETSKSIEQASTALETPTAPVVAAEVSSPLAAELVSSASSPDNAEDESNKPGLAASMHASISLPESASLPDLAHPMPIVPHGFNPTHQRAHTVGRAQAFNHVNTAPAFQQRFSRSGASTPRGGYGPQPYHGRTHSSPPTGSGLNPRVHSQRPIITGDAISRLARTIGGIPPPRVKEVSVAKD